MQTLICSSILIHEALNVFVKTIEDEIRLVSKQHVVACYMVSIVLLKMCRCCNYSCIVLIYLALC